MGVVGGFNLIATTFVTGLKIHRAPVLGVQSCAHGFLTAGNDLDHKGGVGHQILFVN